MNGKIKFHKATGPAFAQGEVWVSASGVKVEIVSVRKCIGATTDHSSEYLVTYKTDPKNKPDLTGKQMVGTSNCATPTRPMLA